jgi:hypothetical protein
MQEALCFSTGTTWRATPDLDLVHAEGHIGSLDRFGEVGAFQRSIRYKEEARNVHAMMVLEEGVEPS